MVMFVMIVMMTTTKPYKYVTDNNDDHDYDYGDDDYDDTDNLCQQPNMNQHRNYTCRSIHQASQLIYKYNASEALQM